MNKKFALTCGLMAAFWLCVCPSFDSALSQQPADEKKVIDTLTQISTQFSAAYVKGDIEKLISLYTDDAVIFPELRQIFDRLETRQRRCVENAPGYVEQPAEAGIAERGERRA